MTLCVGIKVKEGLVAIADTRIISGNECISARKVTVYRENGHRMFVMTSGLRSARDKALTYFERTLEMHEAPFEYLFQAVNALAEEVRRVRDEDRKALEESGLTFNMHTLIGGQLGKDKEHKLYLLYPEGNWVEIGEGTPYQMIGSSSYGKPVLDRTLKYTDSIDFAFKVGCLAFDSTRISAADVDYPIDVVLFRQGTDRMIERRYTETDLKPLSSWWQEHLRELLTRLPGDCLEPFLNELKANGIPHPPRDRVPV